jgi:pimeloyl-ACP methyl ester carboxylesterase
VRRLVAAVVVVLLVVLVGGTAFVVTRGSGSDAGGPTPVAPSGGPAASEPPSPALARFYSQSLDWSGCGDGNQCASLTVPLDYLDPAGATIKIHVLKVPASGSRIGSLVVNPGGPGAAGTSYAAGKGTYFGDPLLAHFDVVGFDPRGTGRSSPVDCLDDRAFNAYLSSDPDPRTPAEIAQFRRQQRSLAQGCARTSGALAAHVSTVESARDMDILRAALGDTQLNYLGKSYGTFLGSTYADLFPQRVGRVVLDGVVPPDLTSAELGEGQARGFEIATKAYIEDCLTEDCPLGSTPEAALKGLDDFFRQVDRQPLPTGDPSAPLLTEGWARLGVAVALYDQGSWGFLTDALTEAEAGNGQSLMRLADAYAGRRPGGGYDGNLMESIFAVNCLDRPDSPDLSAYETYAKDFSARAPTWGANLAWGALPCGVWPVKSAVGPHKVAAPGSNPIVVVGTTRDPATIYEWSKRLRDQLDNAVLVSYDGDGHTAYGRSNTCVDSAIDAYYVQGRVPKDGLKC